MEQEGKGDGGEEEGGVVDWHGGLRELKEWNTGWRRVGVGRWKGIHEVSFPRRAVKIARVQPPLHNVFSQTRDHIAP